MRKRTPIIPAKNLIEDIIKTASPQELEFLGKSVSADTAKEFIMSLSHDKVQEWKLQPIFVGLSHDTFSRLLLDMDDPLRQILIKLSASESIQHHLSVFSRELMHFSEEADRQILIVQGEIQSLREEEIHKTNLQAIQRTLDHFKQDYGNELQKIENALSIAWNGQSGELIDLLSTFKEQYQRVLRDIIGISANERSKATGLYELLERKLAQVFDETLKDDDSAILALANLSMHYAKDYWEIGLLPSVKKPDKLDLSRLPLEENGHIQQEVGKNLKKMGLVTVGDFKKRGIYSKRMLAEYIQNSCYTTRGPQWRI